MTVLKSSHPVDFKTDNLLFEFGQVEAEILPKETWKFSCGHGVYQLISFIIIRGRASDFTVKLYLACSQNCICSFLFVFWTLRPMIHMYDKLSTKFYG